MPSSSNRLLPTLFWPPSPRLSVSCNTLTPWPRDSNVSMPPSSSSGWATVCIKRAVVCRRRSISFRPVEPVSMGIGLVSTQGDGTCPETVAHRSVSRRHSRAIAARSSVRFGKAIVVRNRSESSQPSTEYTNRRDGATKAGFPQRQRLHVLLVHIAPLPIAGLERLHHCVSGLFEVLVGVVTGRRVATPD